MLSLPPTVTDSQLFFLPLNLPSSYTGKHKLNNKKEKEKHNTIADWFPSSLSPRILQEGFKCPSPKASKCHFNMRQRSGKHLWAGDSPPTCWHLHWPFSLLCALGGQPAWTAAKDSPVHWLTRRGSASWGDRWEVRVQEENEIQAFPPAHSLRAVVGCSIFPSVCPSSYRPLSSFLSPLLSLASQGLLHHPLVHLHLWEKSLL